MELEELSRWATQVMLAEVPKSPVGMPRGAGQVDGRLLEIKGVRSTVDFVNPKLR